jgi:nucleotide-binding universal stress UspA family protein
MFNKILVPLDGSALAERAIDQVEKMAKGSVAEVLLLKVDPPSHGAPGLAGPGVPPVLSPSTFP